MKNERGTYIFNSKDLCMIEHIPEMIDAGIDSFKIEGTDEDGALCGYGSQDLPEGHR